MNDHLFLIFKSMTHVLSAERMARKQGIQCRMVPIPRNLSTDCGMCISVKTESGDELIELLEKRGLTPDRIEERRGPGPGSRCYSS